MRFALCAIFLYFTQNRQVANLIILVRIFIVICRSKCKNIFGWRYGVLQLMLRKHKAGVFWLSLAQHVLCCLATHFTYSNTSGLVIL